MAVFAWDVENKNDHALDVSIMFTVLNGSGHKDDKSGGHWNEPFRLEKDGEAVSGVLLHHCTAVNPYTLCIAAREQVRFTRCKGRAGNVESKPQDFDRPGACVSVFEQPERDITHQTAFSPKGTCNDLWSDLITDGRLDSPTGRRWQNQSSLENS